MFFTIFLKVVQMVDLQCFTAIDVVGFLTFIASSESYAIFWGDFRSQGSCSESMIQVTQQLCRACFQQLFYVRFRRGDVFSNEKYRSHIWSMNLGRNSSRRPLSQLRLSSASMFQDGEYDYASVESCPRLFCMYFLEGQHLLPKACELTGFCRIPG